VTDNTHKIRGTIHAAMLDAPKRLYIKIRLSPRGKICALFHGPEAQMVLFVTLATLCSSSDESAGGAMALSVVSAVLIVGVAGLIVRGYQHDVERAVLELVRRAEPMRRATLLKACRPERLRPSVLLATEKLVDEGRLVHSGNGYSVSTHGHATR